MLSAQMAFNISEKDLQRELRELKESEEREKKITEEFNKSMKKLSFLL